MGALRGERAWGNRTCREKRCAQMMMRFSTSKGSGEGMVGGGLSGQVWRKGRAKVKIGRC